MCARGEGYDKYDTYTLYPTVVATPSPSGKTVRVSKALGSKGYGKMRLSAIYHTGIDLPDRAPRSGILAGVSSVFQGSFTVASLSIAFHSFRVLPVRSTTRAKYSGGITPCLDHGGSKPLDSSTSLVLRRRGIPAAMAFSTSR